jgi:hypothetical protein
MTATPILICLRSLLALAVCLLGMAVSAAAACPEDDVWVVSTRRLPGVCDLPSHTSFDVEQRIAGRWERGDMPSEDVLNPATEAVIGRAPVGGVGMAEAAIADIQARGRVPIVVGGTNLYIRAFLEGLDDAPAADAVFRAALEAVPSEDGGVRHLLGKAVARRALRA